MMDRSPIQKKGDLPFVVSCLSLFLPTSNGLWGFAACALLALAGCTDDSPSLTRLANAAAPHLGAFDEFEIWAHRARDAVPDAADIEVLSETTFAPIRHDQDVLFAIVEHRGRSVRRIDLPAGTTVPSDVHWAPLQLGGQRPVGAALAARCPVVLPGHWRDGAGKEACVLLSRHSEHGAGTSLLLTMGFAVIQLPESGSLP